jgi:thiol-disulfide isomerase/thioredoxin
VTAERAAGAGLGGVLAAALLLNAVFVARHCDELRPLRAGDLAPDFEAPRADGTGSVRLSALAGKVVLIDFWATWCGPCARTMPMIGRLHERHRAAGFEVLSINTDGGDDGPDLALRYAAAHELPYAVHVDPGDVAERYRVTVIPHMVVVDRQGRVVLVHVGANGLGALERRLDALIPGL